jgi:hypothetical protein
VDKGIVAARTLFLVYFFLVYLSTNHQPDGIFRQPGRAWAQGRVPDLEAGSFGPLAGVLDDQHGAWRGRGGG